MTSESGITPLPSLPLSLHSTSYTNFRKELAEKFLYDWDRCKHWRVRSVDSIVLDIYHLTPNFDDHRAEDFIHEIHASWRIYGARVEFHAVAVPNSYHVTVCEVPESDSE